MAEANKQTDVQTKAQPPVRVYCEVDAARLEQMGRDLRFRLLGWLVERRDAKCPHAAKAMPDGCPQRWSRELHAAQQVLERLYVQLCQAQEAHADELQLARTGMNREAANLHLTRSCPGAEIKRLPSEEFVATAVPLTKVA